MFCKLCKLGKLDNVFLHCPYNDKLRTFISNAEAIQNIVGAMKMTELPDNPIVKRFDCGGWGVL